MATAPIAVTVRQAASLIGTNTKQILRAIHAGELRAVRLGKTYHVAVVALQKWFDKK